MKENIGKYQLVKVFAQILSVILAILLISICSNGQSFLFDVDTHWSKQYVEYLVDKGAINGYPDGTFRPDNTVTYGEAIKLIVASYNKNIQNGDVHWASTYVQYAKDTEIVTSSMNIDENVDKPISRKEVIYMVYQSLIQYAHKPITNNDRNEIDLPFTDVTVDINKYGTDYIKPIKECYYLGIIIGHDTGLMCPEDTITRAEIATILTRAYSEEYRSYPANGIVGFFPSNADKYRTVLAYMNNSFYEYESKYVKYAKGGTPYEYLDPLVRDGTGIALDTARNKAERAINAMFNVSYNMTDNQWNLWKENISIFNDITQEQIEQYIQYVKDNRIAIRGGALMNPCTIGIFNKNNSETSLGMKGLLNYNIETNPMNKQYLTISEFVQNKMNISSIVKPKYVVMYLEENEDLLIYSLYNFKYKMNDIIYVGE